MSLQRLEHSSDYKGMANQTDMDTINYFLRENHTIAV